MYLSRATCESMDRAEFRRNNPINKDGTYVWPPKNYVWASDPNSYHNDPAQQWDDPDRMREDAERRFKARCEEAEKKAEAEAEKNND